MSIAYSMFLVAVTCMQSRCLISRVVLCVYGSLTSCVLYHGKYQELLTALLQPIHFEICKWILRWISTQLKRFWIQCWRTLVFRSDELNKKTLSALRGTTSLAFSICVVVDCLVSNGLFALCPGVIYLAQVLVCHWKYYSVHRIWG